MTCNDLICPIPHKICTMQHYRKRTPFILCLLSERKTISMKGDIMFRNIRENGEWGTPEQKKGIFYADIFL